ncbi:histidine--tRNA ligase [Scrofimicrobium canadense]|nr:ATP phosphoribosyltransferase regulatory subunit [Scrofimicrobium canadense]
MANPVVPARGMRDILPSEKEKRDQILSTIADVYLRAGFLPIETPAVEPLSRLTSGQGGENEKMLFQIMKRGLPADGTVAVRDAADLGLRYDLTVPLTRYYASNIADLPRVFRAFQSGPVWRAERPQKGRYRQFIQCDIDILGDESITAEVDLVVTTLSALTALGLGDQVKVLVNDRRFLIGILAAAGIGDDNVDAALIALDKADKIGLGGVRAELVDKGIADAQSADRLLALVASLQDEQVCETALKDGHVVVGDREVSLQDLPAIVAAVRELIPQARIEFDPTLVRGMGYYTGAIFEVKHKERDYSIAGGGRYDKVVGKWLGRDVPACGFSIGFERIVDLVADTETQGKKVALLYKPGGSPVDLLRLRQELLDQGASVSLVVPPRRPNSQFFDGLAEQGYTHSLDARREASAADLRELSF